MNYFDIYTMKLFNRLRNKAQMFSSLADDHYHTRLIHSLEVNDISLEIVKRLKRNYIENEMIQNIDEKLVSNIALLHDIGHTPYGHIGERTLHEICSGKMNISTRYNINDLNITCGFKHNINSGLLYKEYLLLHQKEITEFECKVCDGIMKHTSIYYKNEESLDYGFGFVTSGITQKSKIFDIKYNNDSATVEGLIVSFADEIAQVSSDYIDLKTCEGDDKICDLDNCDVFKNIDEIDMRLKAKKAVEKLIDTYVKCFYYDATKDYYKLTYFMHLITDFDNIRSELIKNNSKIRIHDEIKEAYVKQLYAFYFDNPIESNDLLIDFIGRCTDLDLSKILLEEVNDIIKNTSISKDDKKKQIYDFVQNKLEYLNTNKKSNNNDVKYNKADLYKICKLYVKSVAIDISKMTDGYADHKINKLTKPIRKK